MERPGKSFGRSRSELSLISNHTLAMIWEDHGHLLELTRERFDIGTLESFAASLKCPLKNCIGFIDGTIRGISRPTKAQKEFYNGQKRKHALKYQSFVNLDGMIMCLHRPVSGRGTICLC